MNLVGRQIMTSYAAGRLEVPDAPEIFRSGLEHFDVQGVCLQVSDESPKAREILLELGFRRTRSSLDYEIWVRS